MKLELRGMTKRFGSVVANDDISLTVQPGEIVGLLGENGAGKSTLMNLLFGLYQADKGEILLDDQPVTFRGPGDAIAAGIGMVHQHFMLVPVFTVAENVVLGHEPTGPLGSLNLERARELVREISQRFGFTIDPDAVIEDLPVGVQQRVEIVKALSRDARVLILDEPTAVLTPQETDELMEIMKQLASEGRSIVFITHKLREVKEVCDRIVVIRNGKIVDSCSPDASAEELASLMVGRAVDLSVDKSPPKAGEVVLAVRNLSVVDERHQRVLDDVSFDVHRGEIFAIAGVQGNGQSELVEALIGLRQPASGTITLEGDEITHYSVRSVLNRGVGFIPEDRKKDGLVAEFSLEENFMLNSYGSAPWVKGVTIDRLARGQKSRELIEQYDVRTPGEKTLAKNLSGGNQQKVVVARELSKDLKVLVAAQPTRGVDVGSIEFIHEQIVATRDRGIPVVIVSTELDEIYALADRIAVMYRGKIIATVDASIPRYELGKLMAGMTEGVSA